ncbi:MAG: hypothetical protein RIC55_05085 [Pirellulaceae bacterium]
MDALALTMGCCVIIAAIRAASLGDTISIFVGVLISGMLSVYCLSKCRSAEALLAWFLLTLLVAFVFAGLAAMSGIQLYPRAGR